jgi:hypothetical protein
MSRQVDTIASMPNEPATVAPPVLRTIPFSGWSASVTVADKVYYQTGELPVEAIYKLSIDLANDLDHARSAIRGLLAAGYEHPAQAAEEEE